MTRVEDHDLIELKRITDRWKACLGDYQAAMNSGSLAQAREAEGERRTLFAELHPVVNRLRAKQPEDTGVRAIWEQLNQVDGFLLFGTASGITPYLEKLVGRPQSDWQPLGGGALDRMNPRAIHNNWMTQEWPNRLLKARTARGMTQKEAAYACGVAEQTYERWERGEQPPTINNIPKVLAFIRFAEEKQSTSSHQ